MQNLITLMIICIRIFRAKIILAETGGTYGAGTSFVKAMGLNIHFFTASIAGVPMLLNADGKHRFRSMLMEATGQSQT